MTVRFSIKPPKVGEIFTINKQSYRVYAESKLTPLEDCWIVYVQAVKKEKGKKR